MANPTTYFGWVMPNSADLVTDLPADFNVFGQGVDTSMQYLLGGTTGQILSKTSGTNKAFTWINNDQGDITGVTAGTGISGGGTSGTVTVTNSMATAFTTSGDLIQATGSGTFARLGTGTNGQYLTTNGTTNSWGSLSASGLSLIKQASFSNVASTTTTFDSMFSSTYLSYLVTIDAIYAATSADDLQLQFLYSGTTQATGYYGASLAASVTGASPVTTGTSNQAQLTVYAATGQSTAGSEGTGYFFVTGAKGSSGVARAQGMFVEGNDIGDPAFFGGRSITARTYTGFLLKSSSSNITGTVSVYGLAK